MSWLERIKMLFLYRQSLQEVEEKGFEARERVAAIAHKCAEQCIAGLAHDEVRATSSRIKNLASGHAANYLSQAERDMFSSSSGPWPLTKDDIHVVFEQEFQQVLGVEGGRHHHV